MISHDTQSECPVPNELLSEIVSHFDPDDKADQSALSALSLCSYGLYNLALPHRFKSATVNFSAFAINRTRTLQDFISFLDESPAVCLNVITLKLVAHGDVDNDQGPLQEILYRLPKLRHLILHNFRSVPFASRVYPIPTLYAHRPPIDLDTVEIAWPTPRICISVLGIFYLLRIFGKVNSVSIFGDRSIFICKDHHNIHNPYPDQYPPSLQVASWRINCLPSCASFADIIGKSPYLPSLRSFDIGNLLGAHSEQLGDAMCAINPNLRHIGLDLFGGLDDVAISFLNLSSCSALSSIRIRINLFSDHLALNAHSWSTLKKIFASFDPDNTPRLRIVTVEVVMNEPKKEFFDAMDLETPILSLPHKLDKVVVALKSNEGIEGARLYVMEKCPQLEKQGLLKIEQLTAPYVFLR